MTGGFLITLREGLEAFLVVGIILAYLTRVDLRALHKWIYGGAALGVVSAFGLAVVFQLFISGFESPMMELYVKVGIMAFAVGVLSYMIVWMAHNSRAIKGTVERKIERAVGTGSVIALVAMAYLAVLREGFETVLFLGAMFGSAINMEVFYGGSLGLAASLLVTIALFRGMRRVPIKLFFQITGGLILLIAAGLLTNMVGIMQDLEWITALRATVVDLTWLMDDGSQVGIFFKALFGYTARPSVLQVAAYLGYMGAIYFFVYRPKFKESERELAHA